MAFAEFLNYKQTPSWSFANTDSILTLMPGENFARAALTFNPLDNKALHKNPF